MIKIDTFVLGQLQTNTYCLISSQNNCYLIDPADDFVFLSDYVINHGLNIKGIILTHGHFDHCLAAVTHKHIFKIPILANEKDLFLLKKIHTSSHYWTQTEYPILPIIKLDIDLQQRNTINLDDIVIKVINTPGHTPGSVCLYIPQSKIVFSGDTLFKNAIGRTDFIYSDKNLLKKSLRQILSYPLNTVIYPGHGPQTTISQEKQNLANFI